MADYISDAKRRKLGGLLGAMDTDPEAPGLSAYEAATLAFPYGMAGRGIAAVPRAAGGAAGMLMGSGTLNDVEAQSKGAPAAVDPADQAAAAKLPEHLRPQYLDLAARSRARTLNRTERQQLDRMNDILAQSAAAADKAALAEAEKTKDAERAEQAAKNVQRQSMFAADLTRAEEARQKASANEMKPFSEQFPNWNAVQGFAPFAVGALSTLPIAGRAAYGASRAVGKWNKAVDEGLMATTPTDLAKSHATAQAYAAKFPEAGIGATMKPYAVPGVIGALEGAAVSNAPEAYNMFLPAVNPEKRGLQEYLKQLPPDHPARPQAERVLAGLPDTIPEKDAAIKHFTSSAFPARLATGALEGAGGAALATTLAKPFAPSPYGYPSAGTQALADRVEGKYLPQATKAIDAEAAAMGHVLPKAPEPVVAPRYEPPAPPMQPPSQGLLDLPPPAPKPQALPPAQPAAPSVTTLRPAKGGRFDPSLYGVAPAGGLLAADDDNQSAMLALLVRSGLLPPSALQGGR